MDNNEFDERFEDDDGIWYQANIFELFLDWRVILISLASLTFWVCLILSLAHVWAVAATAVLSWWLQGSFVLMLLIALLDYKSC